MPGQPIKEVQKWEVPLYMGLFISMLGNIYERDGMIKHHIHSSAKQYIRMSRYCHQTGIHFHFDTLVLLPFIGMNIGMNHINP